MSRYNSGENIAQLLVQTMFSYYILYQYCNFWPRTFSYFIVE